MKNDEKRIQAAYLTKCSNQAAYDWLKEHQISDIYGRCAVCDKTLERLLLMRNDPLIDLGLAKYGHSEKAITVVYERGNIGTKCAALSNPHIGRTICNLTILREGHPLIYRADRFSKPELEALLKNPNLGEKVIEDVLERKNLFEGKSDSEFIEMLQWLGQNPRMKLEYENTGQFIDGPSDYHHNKVFYTAWRLAETLPTTQDFAHGLCELLSGTISVHPDIFADFQSIIDRWRIEECANEGEPSHFPSYYLRSRIADLAQPKSKMLASDDYAERASFYRRFYPYEFENWPSFIERDKNAFGSLVRNEKLWQCAELRKKLKNAAFYLIKNSTANYDYFNLDEYISFEKHHRKNNPEWFLEEDLEWSDSTEAIIRRLGKNLEEQKNQENIAEIMKFFSNSLSNSIKTSNDKLKEEIRSSRLSIEEVQNNALLRMEKALEKALANISSIRPIPVKIGPRWPWFIVISLLILILFK